MPGFEWQVDDGEEPESWPETEISPPKKRRPWAVWALLLVAVLAAGAVIYRQVDQRLAQSTADVEAEVAATDALVRQIAQQRDAELFLSVLSGREPRWSQTMLRLIQKGLLIDRPAFGLQAQELSEAATSETEETGVQVSLSADFSAAEVVSKQRYLWNGNDGEEREVLLQREVVYRRGEQGWLLAPPEQVYWGEWQIIEDGRLTLVHRQRDGEIAGRLHADLDALLTRLCQTIAEIKCPGDLHVRLRLESDPESLLQPDDPSLFLSSGLRLTMPTPTLVGRPVDDSGYQALLNGYATQMASAVIADLVGYECCERSLFFRALLEKQLGELGLKAWPMSQAEYDLLSWGGLDTATLTALWSQSSVDKSKEWPPVYALVDFLSEEAAESTAVADMQRMLNGEYFGQYLGWVAAVMGEGFEQGRFTTDLLRFIYERTSFASLPSPPIPLPEQEIHLVCLSPSGRGDALYRYNLTSGAWTGVFTPDSVFGLISPLGNERYMVLQRIYGSAQSEARTTLWRDGGPIVVFSAERFDGRAAPGIYPVTQDPTGRYDVLRTYGSSSVADIYYLLDLEQCRPGDCPLQTLPNIPKWSPDGRQTLVAEKVAIGAVLSDHGYSRSQVPLYLGDVRGRQLEQVGTGMNPFWLDDHSYGYTRLVGQISGDQPAIEVVVAHTSVGLRNVLLTAAELLVLPGFDDRPEQLFLTAVVPGPSDAGKLLIAANASATQGSGPGYLFLADLNEERTAVEKLALQYESERPVEFELSPDGRWVAISDKEEGETVINLIDLEGEQQLTLAASGLPFVWTADGQWLVQRFEDYLSLVAPAYAYQKLIFEDLAACRTTLWMAAD